MFLVGRLVEQPKITTTQSGLKMAKLILDVDKNFRNQNGELEVERYACTIWRAVAETVIDRCNVNDLLAVRGRLQASNFTNSSGDVIYSVEIIAENVELL